MRPVLTATLLALATLGSACNRPEPVAPMDAMDRARVALAPAPAARPQGAADAPVRRHIAVRHDLLLQTESDTVEAAWQRAQEACVAAGCEVLASSVSRDDARRPAHAQLEARVPPEKLDAFLKALGTLGRIGQHAQTAEDKTDEVIDVEARLKNMGDFRDSLRRHLAEPGAKLKDLIEVERELVRVQSDLTAWRRGARPWPD